MIKLLNYGQDWAELETSTNPFAVVMMAHLKARETRSGGEQERKRWKVQLVKMLYQRGYERQDIEDVVQTVNAITTREALRALHKQAITVPDLAAFQEALRLTKG